MIALGSPWPLLLQDPPTCHCPRHQGGDHGALAAADFSQRFEKEPVSGHGKQDAWHGEHGAQQAAEEEGQGHEPPTFVRSSPFSC